MIAAAPSLISEQSVRRRGVGHERIALGHVIAVLEIHLPMHLRQRVGHGVGVVLVAMAAIEPSGQW